MLLLINSSSLQLLGRAGFEAKNTILKYHHVGVAGGLCAENKRYHKDQSF